VSTINRYIPIDIASGSLTDVPSEGTLVYQNASSYIEYHGGVFEQAYDLSRFSHVVLYLMAVFLATFVIYILALHFRYRLGGTPVFSILPNAMPRDSEKSFDDITIEYDYKDTAKKLREVFVIIRSRFCKRYCTPRELATENSIPALKLFADVYETVVYGARHGVDVEKVIGEVRMYVREYE